MRSILALVTDAFGGRGGIAQYNRDLIAASADGQRAIAVLPRHAPDPVEGLPPGVCQYPARAGHIAYAGAAFALARRIKPEKVFCGHLYMAPLAALIAKAVRARLVVQLHGIEAWDRPTRLRCAAVEAADLVLCVSRDTRAKVLTWAAIEPERVAVLPNTVRANFCPDDTAAACASLCPGTETVLLTVGRLDARERYKGHDRVIAALPDLVARGYNIVYLIGGDGDDRPRLEALAALAGVADRVRFLGPVPTHALVDHYRMADLFVMPSTGEGFGIAFLEAMACGTPALGLAVAGARDALVDGTLGLAADESGLVQVISDALSAQHLGGPHLAQRVRALFGFDLFAARANALLGRI